MAGEFRVSGKNNAALFTFTIHRGEGMALLAMNWKQGKPPADFVGFAIEYKEPGGGKFYALKNRISFQPERRKPVPNLMSTRLSPIQKFRWVHFPRNADMAGEFLYRVTPVFMNPQEELSYGEAQEAAIELRRETYPDQLNVAFTRGFVSSQAFVDRYVTSDKSIAELLPPDADKGLTFVPTHPRADEALAWMGFEARSAILDLLDRAIADRKAQVRVVAYDLNEPEILSRLEKFGARLKVIIDDEGAHGKAGSSETLAAKRLAASAGIGNVKRQHMGNLQHNKTIVVDGPAVQEILCGSTNFSWRGFYVQANNALTIRGKKAVRAFLAAFDSYWSHDSAAEFGATPPADWTKLDLAGIDARVGFSPHTTHNALLAGIAEDIAGNTTSNLFFSLAFLYQTPGKVLNAIKKLAGDEKLFVYGISDRKVGGLELQKPDGIVAVLQPAALGKDVPEPFKSEPTGGSGTRMHHKFIVIDFDKPTARVYLGSYNFSASSDTLNGENLLLIRNRRIAVAYTVEAIRLIDHYHFRVAQAEGKRKKKQLVLAKPPQTAADKPWWEEDYSDPRKIKDRELFA